MARSSACVAAVRAACADDTAPRPAAITPAYFAAAALRYAYAHLLTLCSARRAFMPLSLRAALLPLISAAADI